MPNYVTTGSIFSLRPGDVALPFSAESPTPPQASAQFALPHYENRADQGRTVVWETSFATAPTAINVTLQAAEVDADANYATIDTSTATAGERRTVASVNAKFLRVRLVSQTAGGAITVRLAA